MKTLLEKTYSLLDKSNQSIPTIAKGAGVNKHWLGKFKQRKFPSPGVLSVQKLYDYLANED